MAVKEYSDWMNIALEEAEQAFSENEIPVGAILVRDNTLILRNHNRTRQNNDPTAHAEKIIIEDILSTGVKQLYDYKLFVTLEPCPMCAGLLVLAKIGVLVFGAYDPKSGAAGSIYNIPLDRQLNHNPTLIGGILDEKCGQILKDFFQTKR